MLQTKLINEEKRNTCGRYYAMCSDPTNKKKVGWEKGNEEKKKEKKMMLCLSSEALKRERERDQKKLNGVTFKWVGGSI